MSALTWVCDLSALPLSAVLKPVTCAWVCVCEVLALPANPGTLGDCAVAPKSPVKRIAPGAELVATAIDCTTVSARDNESVTGCTRSDFFQLLYGASSRAV